MKIFFGYLFLILGTIVTFAQAVIFPSSRYVNGGRLFLLVVLTLGCIIGASLALAKDNSEVGKKFAAGTAFLVCIGLVAHLSYMALTESHGMGGWEYTILILYALGFGIYGFAGTDVLDNL